MSDLDDDYSDDSSIDSEIDLNLDDDNRFCRDEDSRLKALNQFKVSFYFILFYVFLLITHSIFLIPLKVLKIWMKDLTLSLKG